MTKARLLIQDKDSVRLKIIKILIAPGLCLIVFILIYYIENYIELLKVANLTLTVHYCDLWKL